MCNFDEFILHVILPQHQTTYKAGDPIAQTNGPDESTTKHLKQNRNFQGAYDYNKMVIRPGILQPQNNTRFSMNSIRAFQIALNKPKLRA
jgi:hypothetical protein